jgi:formylglycine-generating enzyme required for sulfatase activity
MSMARWPHRALAVGLALSGGALPSLARAERPVVAVFALENKGTRFKPEELDRLLDYIGAALAESGRFQVVPQDELKRALSTQKQESYKACYAESCQIEIGKEVAASKSLAGTIARFGKQCIVTLKLFDLAKSAQEAAGTAKGGCDEAEVVASLDAALAKVAKAMPAEVARPAVVPVATGPSVDYGDLEAEQRRAAERAAQEVAERQAREAAARADWGKIQGFVADDQVSPERRLEVLKKFLGTHHRDNPHAADAQAVLQTVEAARFGAMVEVPAGNFHLGCNDKVDTKCGDKEKPGRSVYLPTFLIDRLEVSVEAFRRCVDAGACKSQGLEMPFWAKKEQPSWAWACNWGKAGRENHPINCVTWEQATAYCRWAKKRLPTNQEWEKAARGADGRRYPWGNADYGEAGAKVGNVADATAKRSQSGWTVAAGYDDGFYGTAPVDAFPDGKSPYGALNMAGNVWEWSSEWFTVDEYRTLRGGSWDTPYTNTRASNLWRNYPDVRSVFVGFRCAQSK